MKILKIIIGIGLILLLMGVVTAADFDVNSLKTTDDYNTFQDGCATYTTNDHRYFFVEKLYGDYKGDWFTNDSDLTVSNVGDNIYYFEYPLFELWGYEEVIMVDDTPYMVSINQDSKLSPSEVNGFLDDLKEFNKLNDLEPIAV